MNPTAPAVAALVSLSQPGGNCNIRVRPSGRCATITLRPAVDVSAALPALREFAGDVEAFRERGCVVVELSECAPELLALLQAAVQNMLDDPTGAPH